MVQRAIRQTSTVNPTTYSAKEEQGNETLNNNGDRTSGRHWNYIADRLNKICLINKLHTNFEVPYL